MFFGSDSGGDSAAVMYSLIGSCKLNGIEPEAWLRHVIQYLACQSRERTAALELPLCKIILTPRSERSAYENYEFTGCIRPDAFLMPKSAREVVSATKFWLVVY
jgi:hypothetical protein